MINKMAMILITLFTFTACGGGGATGTSTVNTESGTTVDGEDNGTGTTTDGDGTSDGTGTGTGGTDTETDTGTSTDIETEVGSSNKPNILLIISDDQGVDASAQYSYSEDLPNTPTLGALATDGIVFDNAWATPACTTTRGSIITGLHGVNSGIDKVPDYLEPTTKTIQRHLKSTSASSDYRTAVIGKWHLGGDEADHPNSAGIDYYAGNLGNIDDYFDWELTINGTQTHESQYHTSKLTDLAINWINDQNSPWFLWLAFSAPHAPFHLPPEDLHQRNLTGASDDIDANPRQYYLASIEAMDAEIGRLLDAMPEADRDNTLIIFIGDNGTPKKTLDTNVYIRPHSKGTLYGGGVRVPMLVSGAGVDRNNERDNALINSVDIYASIAEFTGSPDNTVDGQSFIDLFSASNTDARHYNYVEYVSADVSGWAVTDGIFKLIEFADGTQEFYQLSNDWDERTNLIDQAATYTQEITAFENFAATIRSQANDEPSDTSPTDITNVTLTNNSRNCQDYADRFHSTVRDVNRDLTVHGDLQISVNNGKCVFRTNAIPNHDFNDGDRAFPNEVSEQDDSFEITASPSIASTITELSLIRDNALMLNGVKVDILAAGCFGVGKTGCNDLTTPWRYDPMHEANGFNIDSHNAHTQADGTYHYHGTPNALFHSHVAQESPVIGFAADGFPIYGSYFNDGGTVRQATSSYRLRSGTRPNGQGEPGGNYDGAFRDDYEYVDALGDLDECNGMVVDGEYGYYVTDNYPYILACFKGTPDDSFLKR